MPPLPPPSRPALIAAFLLAVVAAGCGSTDVPRQSVLGQPRAAPEVVWQRAVDVLRTAGFHPASTDPTSGRLVVFSQLRPDVSYAVQFYRQGWVQLQIEGSGLAIWNRTNRPRARVPSNVASEYEALAMSLLNDVVRSGEAGSSGGAAVEVEAEPDGEEPDGEEPDAEAP